LVIKQKKIEVICKLLNNFRITLTQEKTFQNLLRPLSIYLIYRRELK